MVKRKRSGQKRGATRGQICFRTNDNIGAPDADDDYLFLRDCFVDTGDLALLEDTLAPPRIVVGRTGCGKTALLNTLAHDNSDVIRVNPESLALAYITNSTILNYLQSLGVKLDVFFRLLWRHVFTVELLKRHFSISDESKTNTLLGKVRSYFRNDEEDRKALQYLQDWGKSFWQETEYRIQEVTTTLEDQLKAEVPLLNQGLISAGANQTITEAQRQEIINRTQTVINKIQIRALSGIISLIRDVLGDVNKHYYIVIDRLDEDWVEDRIRYGLIRALIETVRDFGKVKNAKIILALRYDLIDRVFRLTRDAGFQEEKYESLLLHVRWTEEQLTELVDKRIRHLLKDRYTTREISHQDVLPRAITHQAPMQYMLERTLMRPRDIIQFFNLAIGYAAPRPKLTAETIRKAEGEHSRKRLRAIADEWYADYPNLLRFVKILKSQPKSFKLCDLADGKCEDLCLNEAITGFQRRDIFSELVPVQPEWESLRSAVV